MRRPALAFRRSRANPSQVVPPNLLYLSEELASLQDASRNSLNESGLRVESFKTGALQPVPEDINTSLLPAARTENLFVLRVAETKVYFSRIVIAIPVAQPFDHPHYEEHSW